MDAKREAGRIRPGDMVRITEGPAAGIKGTVSNIKDGQAHVINLYHGAFHVPVSILRKLEGREGRTP